MVHENVHQGRTDNTTGLEDDRSAQLAEKPGSDPTKNDNEEPKEGAVPEDGGPKQGDVTEERGSEGVLKMTLRP